MKRIRLGNTIDIVWEIFLGKDKDKGKYDLTGKKLTIYLVSAFDRIKISDFTTEFNVLRFTFEGKDQKHQGRYQLTFVENEGGDDTRTLNKCDAFELVKGSCMETDDLSEITIASSFDALRIYPIIPQVGPNRNWWVDGVDTGKSSVGLTAYEFAKEQGYEGTEKEYAAECLAVPVLNEESREATEAATRAAEAATIAAKNATDAAESANNASAEASTNASQAAVATASANEAAEKANEAAGKAEEAIGALGTVIANKADKVKFDGKSYVETDGISTNDFYYCMPDSADGTEDDIISTKSNLKKINGQELYGKGNIVIEGKNYDNEIATLQQKDAEQAAKLAELSAEMEIAKVIDGEFSELGGIRIDGSFKSTTAFVASDYIALTSDISKIEYNCYITEAFNQLCVAFYDKDKVFISGVNICLETKTIINKEEFPTNAAFVRISTLASRVPSISYFKIYVKDKVVDMLPRVEKLEESSAQVAESLEYINNAIEVSLSNSAYYSDGGLSDGIEVENNARSRTGYIPVKKGDIVSSYIYRVVKFDKNLIFINEDLTASDGLSKIDYEVTDESCAFIRLLCLRTQVSSVYLNGNSIIPNMINKALGISDIVGGEYPYKAFNIREVEGEAHLLAKRALLFRDYINGAILGLWFKNPTQDALYYLNSFRYKQVSSDWNNTEYTQIRILEKTPDGSVKNIDIIDDRTSSLVKDDVQVFETDEYKLIVDWTKAQKGYGNAMAINDFLLLDDVITKKNNTPYLTLSAGVTQEPNVSTTILVDGKSFKQNEDGTIEMPLADSSSLGLMSSEDKRKLDGLQQGNIVIEGSGVTKNASAYGFLPTNDGTTNSINLQNCVNGGGTIIVDLAGVYSLSRSVLLDSDTTLLFGNGVLVSLVTENGISPKYPFINRGAFTDEYNQNITIEGLHIQTNGIQGNDIDLLAGQRGYIAMKRIKNLTLKDIEILDVPSGWYTIHIQQFYNINLEHIHVEGMKDGIHLGVGKKFRIAHCLFKTNDDSIALNAHDYPSGTSEFGWIEDGIIEDITILPTPSGNMSRGVYALGGAWTDWKSGNSYQPLGDACVSNNGVYVTMGARSTQKIVSTQQPNHASGKLTYSDGLTWIRLDNQSAQYDAGVRNISVRDLHIASDGRVATFNLDNDDFSNSLYEGCAAPVFENITFENIRQDDYARESAFYTCVPFSNLRLSNFDLKVGLRGISTEKIERDTYSGRCTLLITGMALYQKSIVFIKNDRGQRHLDVKMTGTMIIQNSTSLPTIYGSANVNVVSDIELGRN